MGDIPKKDLRRLRRQYKKLVKIYDELFKVRGSLPIGSDGYCAIFQIKNAVRNTLAPYERLLK